MQSLTLFAGAGLSDGRLRDVTDASAAAGRRVVVADQATAVPRHLELRFARPRRVQYFKSQFVSLLNFRHSFLVLLERELKMNR
jgi:hypothetical protein